MFFIGDISGGQESAPVSFVNEIDSEHLPQTWTYSSVNVPGNGCRVEDFETGLVGCTCGSTNCCAEGWCECICEGSGAVECGEFCPCCPDTCINRVVQHGVRTPLQVFKTRGRGFGVRSLEEIPRGSFVCEYAGEVIGAEEARLRARHQTAEGGQNYLLVLREHTFGKDAAHPTIFDPRHIGNVGRFVNHSCDPNLWASPVRAVHVVPRLSFYASRDLAPMEELSYSYAGTHAIPTDQKCDSGSDSRTPCLCGASCCTGFLPFDPSLLNS